MPKVGDSKKFTNKTSTLFQIKEKMDREIQSLQAVSHTPIGKKLMIESVTENSARIEKYIKECDEARRKQYAHLVGFERPSVQRRRKIRESMLCELDKDVVIPFEQKLNGVIAYIDVWSCGINYSPVVEQLLIAMGAQIENTYNIIVTHVIFQEGSDETFKFGIGNRCEIVSVAWLNAVKHNPYRVPEILFNALKSNAIGAKIQKICEVNENIISNIFSSPQFQSAKRMRANTEDRSKNYKLELINGVVTKVYINQGVPKSDTHMPVNRKLFFKKSKTEIKNDDTNQIKKQKPTHRNIKATLCSSEDNVYSLRSSSKAKTETGKCIDMQHINREPTNHIKLSLSSGDGKSSVCCFDKTKIGIESGHKQIIAPESIKRNITSISLPSEESMYAIHKVPTLHEMDTVDSSDISQIGTFSLYNKKNTLERSFKQKQSTEEMGESSKSISPPKDTVNDDLTAKKPKTGYRKLFTPSDRSMNWNNLSYNISEVTPQRKHPSKKRLLFEKSDKSFKKLSDGQKESLKGAPLCKKLKLNSDENIIGDGSKIIPEIVSYNSIIYNDIVTVAKVLGGFSVSSTITDHSTHLIVPSKFKSHDLPKELPKGCWILPYDWLRCSYNQHEWLPEKQFALRQLM